MSESSPHPDPHSLSRRLVPLALVLPLALALLATRPAFKFNVHDVDPQSAGCLSNLRQIGRAYALYARDYDGKLPWGVDPEDRNNPDIWRDNRAYGGAFYQDAQTAPYLHQVLRPYVASREVFHCPADSGWTQARLPGMSNGLKNVKPSSFAKYGTSYYCLTRWSFSLQTADDIPEPGQKLLVFDGDLWHQNAGQDLMNGLFADGHVQKLSAAQFRIYASG